MTKTGAEFMRGSEKLIMPALEPSKKYEPRKELLTKNFGTGYDNDLFEKLRAVRKRLADEMGVPPFVVFGNAPLQDMARRYPKNEEEFLRINGVGAVKLKQFGKYFLKAINDFMKENGAKDFNQNNEL